MNLTVQLGALERLTDMVKDKDANVFSREGGVDESRMASVRVTGKDGNVLSVRILTCGV